MSDSLLVWYSPDVVVVPAGEGLLVGGDGVDVLYCT